MFTQFTNYIHQKTRQILPNFAASYFKLLGLNHAGFVKSAFISFSLIYQYFSVLREL